MHEEVFVLYCVSWSDEKNKELMQHGLDSLGDLL